MYTALAIAIRLLARRTLTGERYRSAFENTMRNPNINSNRSDARSVKKQNEHFETESAAIVDAEAVM